jgi:hypothetical protein
MASSATTSPELNRLSRMLDEPRLSSLSTVLLWAPEARRAGSVPAQIAARRVTPVVNSSATVSSSNVIQ